MPYIEHSMLAGPDAELDGEKELKLLILRTLASRQMYIVSSLRTLKFI